MAAAGEIILVLLGSLGLFVGLGFLAFTAFVRGQLGGDWAWLGGWGERFSFYLTPFPPRNVVVYTEVDGSTSVYYNVKIEPTRNGYLIELPHARVHAGTLKEAYVDLLGGDWPGVPRTTPRNLAIRAVGGLMFGSYMVYFMAVTRWMGLLGDPVALGLQVAATVLAVAWVFVAYRAAQVPNLRVYELVEWGIEAPLARAATPSIGPLGLSPQEFAGLKGIEVRVVVPESVKGWFDELRERLQRDDLALASLLARAEEAEKLKVEISEVKRRELYSWQLARQYILTRVLHVSVPKLAVAALILLTGIAIGYALGGGDVIISTSPLNATAGGGP